MKPLILSNQERIEIAPHFYYDEFICGGRYRNIKFHPNGCPYCFGTALILPWLIEPIVKVRVKWDVPFAMRSAHRCLNYHRDVWAIYLYRRLYFDCDADQRAEVETHDDSRHMIDGNDIHPVSNNPTERREVLEDLANEFELLGYVKLYGNDFGHFDTRNVTMRRLGI